jgi:uncharacterized protein DUF4190
LDDCNPYLACACGADHRLHQGSCGQASGTGGPEANSSNEGWRAVYPVIGYTPDGKPITADQAVGYQPVNRRTNGTAIAAFVLSLLVAPLGVVVGHVARIQIRQTGESGDGLAIAALVLGYLGTIGLVILIVSTV